MSSVCLSEATFQSAREVEECLLQRRAPALAALGLPADFVLPSYGLSIANLPSTLAAVLGGELAGAEPPLPESLWAGLASDVRRVVWLILDSVGWLHLRRFLDSENDLFLARLAREGRFLPITSVLPSSTTSALITLWTGYAPAQHGMVGHLMYLKEFGAVADMLMLSQTGHMRRDELVDRGLNLKTFLPVPGLAESLLSQGIVTRALIDDVLMRTGFSRLCFRGVTEVDHFVTATDMAVHLRQMLAARQGERLLVVGYLAEIDAIGHLHGADGECWRADLRTLNRMLEHEFYSHLSPRERRGTLLVISSDHGQLSGEGRPVILTEHPRLWDSLLLPVTGSSRMAYLFARLRHMQEATQYLQEHLADGFAVVDSQVALEAGLLGPGQPAPAVASRLGDLIVLGRDRCLLDYRKRDHLPRGMHAGASAEEMLSPLLLARLD